MVFINCDCPARIALPTDAQPANSFMFSRVLTNEAPDLICSPVAPPFIPAKLPVIPLILK